MSAESLASELTPVTGPVLGTSGFGFDPDGWPLTERIYTPPTSLGEAIDDVANFLLICKGCGLPRCTTKSFKPIAS